LDSRAHGVEVRSRIGFVHERPGLWEHLPAGQLKSIYARFYPSWDEPTFERLADAFELPLDRKVKALSSGMRTRLSLALALSHGAELLILDEPTTGLDPVFRRQLLDRLRALMEDEGKTILFSTHITSDLETIADHVTFLQRGRLVFSSSRETLAESWALVKGPRELLAEADPPPGFVKGIRRHDYGMEALVADAAAARRHFGAETVMERASLEDIVYLTGRGLGRG
jgi:ABC-2 type transport system ATP-binding protein